jgi:hypothetical protein
MKFLAQIGFAAVALFAPSATVDSGLEVNLWIRGADPKGVAQLASLSDAVVTLRFQNRSTKSLTLAVDDEQRRYMALPLLATLEVTREDKTPLVLPEIEVGSNWGIGGAVGNLLFMVPMRWLPSEGLFDWTIPVADWPGWQSIELAPGRYRVRVVYHGPPDLTGLPHPDAGAVAAWRGVAASPELAIEITGGDESLTFGEPQHGLRVAPRPDPRGDRYLTDETIPMQFVVENVTDGPVEVTRVVGGSQEDEITIGTADGGEILDGSVMCTGWDPVVKLTLPAHARARLFAGAARFGAETVTIGNRSGPAAPAGRYRVRHKLAVTFGNTEPVDHVVPRRSWITVPEREIEILARR